MIEEKADLWAREADARCVTTNGVLRSNGHLVMGAGVAKQALVKYPGIDKRLGDLVKVFGNVPHFLPDVGIISFPTKHNWKDCSDLSLIILSSEHLIRLCEAHRLKRVVLPRPGCGLGNLSWREVRAAIEPILDDRFVVVH